MKKNGKRYRRLQREKEIKKNGQNPDWAKRMEQEVDGINTALLSMSQIVIENPIRNDRLTVKQEYLRRLNSYINAGCWNRRKYEKAQLDAYKKIILDSEENTLQEHGLDYYHYYILFDMLHVLGYEIKNIPGQMLQTVLNKYYLDYPEVKVKNELIKRIIGAIKEGNNRKLKLLERHPDLEKEHSYIELIRKNIAFKEKEPYGVMVTATMSAGKSTFINSLTGKYISLSQNMACTSKIHSIIGKAYEDGFSYEYDHDLVMTAGREELLNDNEMNASDKIVVSTYFNGILGGRRMVINDSPGVNFSGDPEHKKIANSLIKRRNYHLLIYLMNATQLATNDEDEHLEYIKKTVGRTPILFVVNKIDTFNVEEENFRETIERLTEYLKKKGFKHPIVCPVSSRAGYLAKMFCSGSLSRSEERELYNYVDKFEQMELSKYYEENYNKVKIPDADTEEGQLIKTCGLAYVEKFIEILSQGGEIYGTGLY